MIMTKVKVQVGTQTQTGIHSDDCTYERGQDITTRQYNDVRPTYYNETYDRHNTGPLTDGARRRSLRLDNPISLVRGRYAIKETTIKRVSIPVFDGNVKVYETETFLQNRNC